MQGKALAPDTTLVPRAGADTVQARPRKGVTTMVGQPPSHRESPRLSTIASRLGRIPDTARWRGSPARLDLALLAMGVALGAVWVWSWASRRQTAKRRPDMPTLAGGRGLHVERSVTVLKPPDELY